MKHIFLFLIISLFATAAYSQTSVTDSLHKQLDSLPHAKLYFYRSYIKPINAPIKKVPIYINDTLVFNLKANNLIEVSIYREGKFKISADKKGETILPVTVKFGKEYFFRCTVEKGLWFGKPEITGVPVKVGIAETGMLEKDTGKE